MLNDFPQGKRPGLHRVDIATGMEGPKNNEMLSYRCLVSPAQPQIGLCESATCLGGSWHSQNLQNHQQFEQPNVAKRVSLLVEGEAMLE